MTVQGAVKERREFLGKTRTFLYSLDKCFKNTRG